MATIDIFNDDAFSTVELAAALEDVEYQPSWLGSLNVFTERSVRTSHVMIEKKEQVLSLVPTTPRGAPLPQLSGPKRNIRNFVAPRVAKGDRLNASEIANIRAFGSDTELMQVQSEVLAREIALRNDVELTHENMRLGAIQGLVLDADGSTLFDWFAEWGIAQPAEDVWNFATLVDGALREKCNQTVRRMMKASKGAWRPTTQVYALAGDDFYDALIKNKEVRDTYLGWSAAADLRQAMLYDPFPFGGINWVNYRGTDDGTTVGIPAGKVKFFPVGAPEAFLRVNAPGETFETINQPGRPFYPMTVPDRDRQMYVDIELYSYPLYAATRPGMLLRGKLP